MSDAAAILFAQTFYGALFDGSTIGESFATGAAAVQARYEDEADTPILKNKAGVDPERQRIVDC